MSTPMAIDSPQRLSSGTNGINRQLNGPNPTQKVTEVISSFRPTKLFRRDDKGKPSSILSLDFDDQGELLVTSESDETIQIYNVKDGKHSKQALSKKYGAKLAIFSHTPSCVIHASSKNDDTIRYLSTHDNSYIRYFRGHERPVTCLTMNPGGDTFISCSEDDTVRIWDVNSQNAVGKLYLAHSYLSAFDPSANVIAIASPAAQTILLYDFRNWDKEPFATFDMLQYTQEYLPGNQSKGWNKLEFSNDGKSLLVGTNGGGHFVLDAFDGGLKSFLNRSNGGAKRLAAGEHNPEGADPSEALQESSGDACFSPDGRFVLSGRARDNLLIWDTLAPSGANKIQAPTHELEHKSQAAVLAFNPRFNFFASADKEVVFWVPDQNAI